MQSGCMNDMLTGQLICPGNLGLSCLTSIQHSAFSQEFRSRRSVDRSVYTATSEKARIGCIYDCLHAMVLCNISAYCFKLCLSLQDQVFHPSTAYRCIFLSSPGPHNDRIHSSDIHGKDRLPSQ